MSVDTDLFEEFMKAAQAADEPEEPEKTIGERYREEQLEKRGSPKLKDWYRKALQERAKLQEGEPGAYQPVLNALAISEQKQKANVFTLSTSGTIKDPSDIIPLLGGDYSNTALLNRANRDTLWKAITGWEEPEEGTGIETDLLGGTKVLPSLAEPPPPKGPSGQGPPVPAYVERLSAADAGVVIPPINEWDYLDPPRAESGITYNQWGDPLPPFAFGWGPLGYPNYGQGPIGQIRKAISNVYTGKALWGTTPEERGEGWYSKARRVVGIGKGSIPTMIANAYFSSILFPILNASAEALERGLGTASLLAEEMGKYSDVPAMSEDIEPALISIVLGGRDPAFEPPEWITDVVQRINPSRNSHNLIRAIDAVVRGGLSFDDIAKMGKDSFYQSKMAYSIGANENETKVEFNRRVAGGEQPDLVARDMMQPLSEGLGLIFGDPLWFWDIWLKFGAHIDDVAKFAKIVGPSDEVVPILEKLLPRGDDILDVADVPAGSRRALFDAFRVTLERVQEGIDTKGLTFGLVHRGPEGGVQLSRTGMQKRYIASKDIDMFSRVLGSWSGGNPDHVADMVVALAHLASGDAEKALSMMNYLIDAMPTQQVGNATLLFSEGAAELANMAFRLMDDGTGVVRPKIFYSGINKIVKDGGDVADIIAYVDKVFRKSVAKAFPTVKELVEGKKLLDAGKEVADNIKTFYASGGKINALDRIIAFAEAKPGILGAQSQIAGTLYVGSNPRVATRGMNWDNLVGVLDIGPQVYFNSPKRWAEQASEFLKFDHPAFTQGVSKTDISQLNKLGSDLTKGKYQDIGTIWDFIRQGADWKEMGILKKAWTTLTEGGGWLLQYGEIQSSIKMAGYTAVSDMKHLIRRGLPKIDDLMQLGMPPDIAASLSQRLINSYGDTDQVMLTLLEEINKTGGANKISGMTWINKQVVKTLEDFLVYDEIAKVLSKTDASLDDLVGGVRDIWTRLMVIADEAKTQHVIPRKSTVPEDAIETIVEGIFPALEQAHLSDAFVFDLSDTVAANVDFKNAIAIAGRELETIFINQISDNIAGLTEEAVRAQRLTLREAFRQIDNITDGWATATGTSQAKSNGAWGFTRKLFDETENLRELIDEITYFFKFDKGTIPAGTNADGVRDIMWTAWKQMQKADFAVSRKEMGQVFFAFLDNLKTTMPDIAKQIDESPLVIDVINRGLDADAIGQAVMIGDKLKPVGFMMKGAMELGLEPQAIRLLGSYLNPYADFGAKGSDATILQAVNKYSDEIFKTFDDLTLDATFEALQKLRDDKGWPKLVDSMSDFTGYKVADVIKPFAEIADDDIIKIYQGRPAKFDPTTGYSQSWSRDPKFAKNYAGEGGQIFTKEISGAEWKAAVEETYAQGARAAVSDKAKLTGLEEGRFLPSARTGEEWYQLQDKTAEHLPKILQNFSQETNDMGYQSMNAGDVWRQMAQSFDNPKYIDWSYIREKTNRLRSMMDDFPQDFRALQATPPHEATDELLDFWRGLEGQMPASGMESARKLNIAILEGDETAIRVALDEVERLIDNPDLWTYTAPKFAEEAQVLDIPTFDEVVQGAPSITPPIVGDASYPQAVAFNKWKLGAAIEDVLGGVRENFGKMDYVNLTDELVEGTTKWFEVVKRRMATFRASAAYHAQAIRDFGLHDYGDRFAIDALIGVPWNFHLWSTRTLLKTPQRAANNLPFLNRYAIYRKTMERYHSDLPPWLRQKLNSDELLGIHTDNPFLFDLESAFMPFVNMMGGFDDPDRRVNWWSTAVDDMNRVGIGSVNMILNYAVAAGLKATNEDEAASLWGGRLVPITEQVKGLTSLLGVNEGRGVELDPSIRAFAEEDFFSEKVLGPYEREQVAKALAHYAYNNPELNITEEAMENAWKNGGPLWDVGVALARQHKAPGNLLSTILGIGVQSRSEDDLVTSQFWFDYIQLMNRSDTMDGEEYRKERQRLWNQYPFATMMLLGRKGGEERDVAYAYDVMGRITPGKLDDLAKVAGLPYEVIENFYDSKGRPEDMNDKDWEEFMLFIAQGGATLALPDNFTKGEWNDAKGKYQDILVEGQEKFAPYVWELVDHGYWIKGNSMNQQRAWYDFLEQFPIVEEAMAWKETQIFDDLVLAAYYGSQNTLRSMYLGQMYQTLEDEFGTGIWDKVILYDAFRDSGQPDAAKAYKKANPDLKAYYDARDVLSEVVTAKMVEYGEMLPEGEDMRLREDLPKEPSVIEQKIIDFIEEPKPKTYNRREWIELIGKEDYAVARIAWEEIPIPEDTENRLREIARDFNMTYEEFLISIGATD